MLSQFRRTTGSIKAASGFLKSMKSLIGGIKTPVPSLKVSEASVPLIQVEKIPDNNSDGEKNHPKNKPLLKTIKEKDQQQQQQQQVKNESKSAEVLRKEEENTRITEIKGKKISSWPIADRERDDSKASTDPPEQRLKMKWVYGYRGHDCRSNIYVLKSGEIIYFIGTIVILYDRERHMQRHYKEHVGEIKCISVHPNGVTVATGQRMGQEVNKDGKEHLPNVRIWRSDTLQTLQIVGGDIFKGSVVALAFSRAKAAFVTPKSTVCQERLVAVDKGDKFKKNLRTLGVWDIGNGKLISQTELTMDALMDLDFNPKNSDVLGIIGKEHIGWWNVSVGQNQDEIGSIQQIAKPEYGDYLRAKYITCMFYHEKGDMITGDSNGTVYIWGKEKDGNTISNFVKHVHDGSVFAILVIRNHIITGGRDGLINCFHWSRNMDKTGMLQLPNQEGGVRMLQTYKDLLLIGTTTNSILTANLSANALKNPFSGIVINQEFLTAGHFDSVDSLAIPGNPDLDWQVLTCGLDGNICLYDSVKNNVVWKVYTSNMKAICFDINQELNMISIGTSELVVFVYGISVDDTGHVSFDEIGFVDLNKKLLESIDFKNYVCGYLKCLKIAPDCRKILTADVDGKIICLSWEKKQVNKEEVDNDTDKEQDEDEWTIVKVIKAHNSSITAIDWSEDKTNETEYFIFRVSTNSGETSFWKGHDWSQIDGASETAKSYRNFKWWTSNCSTIPQISAIWQSGRAKLAQIQSVDVQQNLTIMGDSKGYVSLFRYPCFKKGVFNHTYKAHESVSATRFSQDGRSIFTVGGSDHTVIQWLVEK